MDFIHDLDEKYTREPVSCPNEGKKAMLQQSKIVSEIHGNMVVHSSGAYLVCGLCGEKQPIARP